MGMRNRIKSVKREHSTIKDILPLLEKIASMPFIKSIIPGRIKPIVGNYPKPIVEFKTLTQAGFKCIAKSSRSVQEVFIVCDDVEESIRLLTEMDLIQKAKKK
jgi:hypothetical protein